jgi:hypothetical protein
LLNPAIYDLICLLGYHPTTLYIEQLLGDVAPTFDDCETIEVFGERHRQQVSQQSLLNRQTYQDSQQAFHEERLTEISQLILEGLCQRFAQQFAVQFFEQFSQRPSADIYLQFLEQIYPELQDQFSQLLYQQPRTRSSEQYVRPFSQQIFEQCSQLIYHQPPNLISPELLDFMSQKLSQQFPQQLLDVISRKFFRKLSEQVSQPSSRPPLDYFFQQLCERVYDTNRLYELPRGRSLVPITEANSSASSNARRPSFIPTVYISLVK